jgi:hypothetical protein
MWTSYTEKSPKWASWSFHEAHFYRKITKVGLMDPNRLFSSLFRGYPHTTEQYIHHQG